MQCGKVRVVRMNPLSAGVGAMATTLETAVGMHYVCVVNVGMPLWVISARPNVCVKRPHM